MKKLDIGVIVTTLIIVTISCSLAFFAARVVGDPKDINLVAKNVSITFADTSSIADTTISPGWSSTKTFTITNNSKEDFSYNIVLSDYVNTFVTSGYLQYKITSSDGYNMNEYLDLPKSINEKDIVIAYKINIPKNSMQTYQVEFRYQSTEEDQSEDMGKILKGQLKITEGTEKPTLYDKILADNPVRSTRDTFDTTFTSNTTETLFTATEKNVHNTTDTTVYYYAGNTTNNWVKFAGYYWRIIRTNADESVRMLYSGTSHDTTEGYLSTGTIAFNSTRNSPKYVGYMYGENDDTLVNARTNTNNSTIKTAIDNWYTQNMISYTKYLSSTAVYCNDRNLRSGDTYSTSARFFYAPSARAYINYTPTYDCTEASDAFSVDNTSAKLDYPIALMTADEIMHAGGKARTNLISPYAWYYLNSAGSSITGSTIWWLLSPYTWYEPDAHVFIVRSLGNPGYVDYSFAYVLRGVRPVISLKGNLIYKSGDGSATNPYEVVAEPVNTYTVSLSVNNGSGSNTVLVEEGKDATFTVTPSDGYKIELETDTCDGTLSGNTYTISNITSDKICSITFKKSGTSLATLIQTNAVNENGYRYEGSDPNNYITMEKTDGTTEMWRIMGLFPDGENGENVIRVRKVGYEKAAYDSNGTNHWPNTTLYKTLSSTYTLANYKNTVNYKMYLGGATDISSYTSQDLYDMERMLNSKGTAGKTSQNSYSNTTTLTGSVGLMYPSDYGYGVLASDCTRTIVPYNYGGTSACKNNNWLYQGSTSSQYVISPSNSDADDVMYIIPYGSIATHDFEGVVYIQGSYAPVMALSADIYVAGSGTQSDPYVMQ